METTLGLYWVSIGIMEKGLGFGVSGLGFRV